MTDRAIKIISGIFVFAVSLGVYFTTLAPTVTFIDSGELAADASLLGIAHPTGYPLFTIIGYLFTKLPIGATEVYRLNFMSAFFCALGVLIFSFFIGYLLKQHNPVTQTATKKGQQTKSKYSAAPDVIVTSIAIFSALVLAFSNTYWDIANAVEVYCLHALFLSALMFVFIKAITNKAEQTSSFLSDNRYYLIFAFVLGLSFTNHLTTILLAPACLMLFVLENYSNRPRLFKLLGWMAVCFIIGFSVYFYLPIRANMNPPLLWGNPYNLERFIWHFTGKQFSVWIFSAPGSVPLFLGLIAVALGLCTYGLIKQKTVSRNYHLIVFIALAILTFLMLSNANEIVSKQFKEFNSSLWKEFGTGLILFALLGVYRLSTFNLKIYYFTLLTFFGCVFYSVNYDIHDIDSYFLLAYMTVPIWISFGALFIYERFKENLAAKGTQIAFAVVLVALSFVTLEVNYTENDESKNVYVEEFTMNVFKNAEPNSIIISSQWDFWVSASWYYNFVKNVRSDLVIIDKELLRRSWYFVFLERHYPEVYNNSRTEIERFLVELYKFENNIYYDPAIIMKTFSDMMTSFVEKNPTRKTYISYEIDQNKQEAFAPERMRLPDGMLFRLVKQADIKNNQVADYKVYDFKFTPTTKTDYYHSTLMTSYATGLTNSANFLITANRMDDARKYLDLALLAKPNYPQAMELKRKAGL